MGELRAFGAATELGSIGEAARALNVSQPALSKRLRTLEAVIGTPLFERTGRGVELTDAGKHLYGAARRVLTTANTLSALIHNPTAVAPVRIWASPTVAEARLPRVLAELAQVEQSVPIELATANSTIVRELVRDGRGDLGVAAVDAYVEPDPRLEGRVIWRDEIVVAVPHGHPWADLAEVPLEEFAETSLIQRDPWSSSNRVVATALEQAGLRPARPVAAIGSTDAVVELAISTRTPALLSRMAVRRHAGRGLAERRVAGIRFDREYALIWTGPLFDQPPQVQTVAQHLLALPFARSRPGPEPAAR